MISCYVPIPILNHETSSHYLK